MSTVINQTTLQQIEKVLDRSELTSSSFSIDTPSESGKPFLIITFRDNTNYRFQVSTTGEYADGESTYMFRMTPGGHTETEVRNVPIGKLLELVSKWCGWVLSEITHESPLYARFAQFKEELNAKIDEHLKDGQSHFNENEKELLLSKLKDLENKFMELQAKQDVTEEELKKVSGLLETLTKNINTLPKKTWYRVAGTKIYELSHIFLTSKAGQKLLDKGVDKLLDPSSIDKLL